ncbi:hypothetical protein WK79_10940 [Burkholderia ubonensis]|uniref:DUF2471 family protein n=1 Tax=Burkholderia ubonensis TaxID=101571 RepID=UPI00075B4783|nr:DUF2471 family protein [Burkholderia ubonensis]KVV25446.1 hypothetical protein WK79_10940 [Burkholderia ubonensis]
MFKPQAHDSFASALERDELEHAKQRALLDLRRIVRDVADRYLKPLPTVHARCAMSWRALGEIEEQAFSDLGFQSRHDPSVIDAFMRLKGGQIAGPNIDEPVDWQLSGPYLPAVYSTVRAITPA